MNGLRFDLTQLSQFCLWLLAGSIALELLATWGYVISFISERTGNSDLLSWALIYSPALAVTDDLNAFDILYSLVILITMVASCFWIYRSSWNARELQPDPARITPGWAVGYFFIPLLNLWKPFAAMRQSWNASVNTNGPIDAPAPLFMKVWWGTWVGTSVLQLYSEQLYQPVFLTPAQQLVQVFVLLICLFCLNIISTLMFMRVIQSISAAQRDRTLGQVEIFA